MINQLYLSSKESRESKDKERKREHHLPLMEAMIHAWQLDHMPKPFCLSEHSIAARRASGAMDNASDYGSEDSRFDSWLARNVFRCHALI